MLDFGLYIRAASKLKVARQPEESGSSSLKVSREWLALFKEDNRTTNRNNVPLDVNICKQMTQFNSHNANTFR